MGKFIMKILLNLLMFLIFCSLTSTCILAQQKSIDTTAFKRTTLQRRWETLRFGAFVHFNDNTFLGKEISQNTDPNIFNPQKIDFDGMMQTFQQAGIRYAVLTARHTSGFCLWESKATKFDVIHSAYPHDVVKLFVDACRKFNIEPCLYYCLWGKHDWNPADWNPIIKKELANHTPKEIILAQLAELAQNYGEIFEFWLDMQCWSDTSLIPQEIYSFLKSKSPQSIVHFNQQVQDGTLIKYFPTDIVNGEERIPPEGGHNPNRIINIKKYYVPFEYEITSQRCDNRTLGNGLMKGSVWFTYPDSHFYPIDSLYKYIRACIDRGGSNVLLSTAPDRTGSYRSQDVESLIQLGRMILQGK
jgi:alpha-L-fucosidase